MEPCLSGKEQGSKRRCDGVKAVCRVCGGMNHRLIREPLVLANGVPGACSKGGEGSFRKD